MKQNMHLFIITAASVLFNASCTQSLTGASDNIAKSTVPRPLTNFQKIEATLPAEQKKESQIELKIKKTASATTHSGAAPQEAPAQKNASEVISKASDSDEIKMSVNYKISFKNLPELVAAAQEKDLAVFKQRTSAASELQEKIKSMNEEHFCQIRVQGQFHPEDYLKLAVSELQQVDPKNDIYQTRLVFRNANGEMTFLCTHTTNNFYVEEFALNMKNLLHIFNLDNEGVALENFSNPRTENRIGNAVKIKNLENFNKVLIKDEAKDLFGMVDGKIMDLDEASSLVARGQSKMSCAIAQVAGQISSDKVYIRVEKGVIEETPTGVPTASLFATYRADEGNAFVITCFTQKTTSWFELTNAASAVLQFGVLERPEYNKKYDEVMALHKKMKEKR